MDNLSLEDLSESQRLAFSLMVKGVNVFITAPAGAGKSFVVKLFCKKYGNSKRIGLTSTTGTSALIIGGTTLHSFLGIGLATGSVEKLYFEITKKRPRKIRDRWLYTDVLIIDEVSMLSTELFEKLEALARSIRKNDKPFGGLQLVFTGDMLQLPSIGSTSLIFESPIWKKCVKRTILLTHIFRQNDDSFQRCLNDCRMGELTETTLFLLKSRCNADLSNSSGILPTKIYCLNIDVDAENEEKLAALREADKNLVYYEYEREYEVMVTPASKVSNIEERINKGCVAQKTLTLCVGAQVMLTYNVDLEAGLSNGTRGVVVNFQMGVDEVEVPIVRFLNGSQRVVSYQTWTIEEDGEPIISVSQIPLKVAYSVTIHRVQGATLDFAEVDLKGVFEYGQAYTALSRVKNLEGLSIKNFSVDKITADPVVVQYYKDLEEKDFTPSV